MISGQTLRVCPEGKPVSTKSCSRTLDAHPFARGSATKREDPPLLTRIKTLFLLSVRAALIASRTSPALVTLFPATSRITSPSLTRHSTQNLLRSFSVTTTPSLPARLSLLWVSALASTAFGNCHGVCSDVVSRERGGHPCLTALPGARAPMV